MGKIIRTKIYLSVIANIWILMMVCPTADAQDLCDASTPNYRPDGFEFLTPSEGCGPFRVKLKDLSNGTDIKFIYLYQGQDKSELNSLNPISDAEYPYFSQDKTSNYTILQYGKDTNGDEFYSCKNVTVFSSNEPNFSYTICPRGVELVIPEDETNSIYSQFKIDILNLGFSKNISQSELPITLNIPMSFPDELKLEGFETNQQQDNCNVVNLNIDPNSNPNGIDAPFDINIDTLELIEEDRVRISFTGSLDQNGYTLQMRESQGGYPSDPLKEKVIPKKIDIELPDPNKSYCFKLSRNQFCYELSTEICTNPITMAEVNKYGEITLEWINHVKPSTSQTFNQKKTIEINKVNKAISSENLPLADSSYSYIMSCGVNKVCFTISNNIEGIFYDYNYKGVSISNEVCISSDSIIASPVSNLFTTINDSEQIDVFFKASEFWDTPISKYFLYHLDNESNKLAIIDSSISDRPFESIQLPLSSENCFSISYIDTCGIKSEISESACTISLSNEYGSNLSWSGLSPFANELVSQYELLALNETNNSFYTLNTLPLEQKQVDVDLSAFEDLAQFRIKATAENGQTSLSNTVEIPLEFKLFIPEAFSPNNDGFNDDFRIFGSLNKIKDFNIKIFNREGKIVFQSNSPEFKWNGQFNEIIASKGTYNYHVLLLSQNDEHVHKQGSVILF